MSGNSKVASTMRLHRYLRRLLPTGTAENQSGQALVIVMGLITMIFLGTIVLASNVAQHNPIVEQDLLQHEAYRAMQAGINTYISETNTNPDYAMCNATIKTVSSYTSSTSYTLTNTSTPTLPTGLCSGPAVGSWTNVPNLASTKGPNAYFTYGNPTVWNCTGTNCPEQVWVSVTVVGASGFQKNSMYYDTGTVNFQPSNGFLLNLWWLNYDQEDPSTIQVTSGGTTTNPACNYYWDNPISTSPYYQHGLVTNCKPVDFASGESLTGNIFSNDSLFICGTAAGQGGNPPASSPTINGTIASHDPLSATVVDPTSSGCTNTISGNDTLEYNQPAEPIPTDDAVLGQLATTGGCLYQGPTEIQLAQNSTTGAWGMDVYSPDTKANYTSTGSGGYTSGSNDSNDSSSDSSECVYPNSTGWGWVPYPSNGVVFVENCLSTNTTCNGSSAYNPLGSAYSAESQWDSGIMEYGTTGATEGDAIVEGTVQDPLTIAAQDNVVISGNICYQSWIQPTSGTFSSCNTAPSPMTTPDMLGLIAYNFVEVNHPVSCSGTVMTTGFCCPQGSYSHGVCSSNASDGWSNASACPGTPEEAPMGPSTSLDCVLDPTGTGTNCGNDVGTTYVDAAILALNQQFWVNADNQGCPMGTLDVTGDISEDWRGPVGTFSGTTAVTGYSKNYTYDARLAYLSPPQYLNPGTASWDLGSISSSIGSCPTAVSGCATFP